MTCLDISCASLVWQLQELLSDENGYWRMRMRMEEERAAAEAEALALSREAELAAAAAAAAGEGSAQAIHHRSFAWTSVSCWLF
jgi:hypothetical protein